MSTQVESFDDTALGVNCPTDDLRIVIWISVFMFPNPSDEKI